MLRRNLKPFALFMTMFLLLGGAPYGTEEIVPMAGPGMSILVLIAMAIFWAAPYALIIAELVTAIPLEGGIYQWFRAGVGPFWSFIFSYVDWVTWVLDSCLYPSLVAAYMTSLFTPEPNRWMTWLVSLIIIWALTALNIRGVQVVGRFMETVTSFVVFPLAAMVVLGWSKISLSSLSPLVPEGTSVTTAMNSAIIWCLWSYSGYGSLASAGEEIVDPERHYPRTLAIFLPLCVLGHVLPLMVGLGATPDWPAWKTAHFNQVALVVGGTWLAALSSLGGQLGGLGLFNGELLITSRMPYAMARDGLLPQFLARLHPRHQTPHVCLILQALLYSILTFFLTFTQLLMVSTWMALPTYVLTFATPILLRCKQPGLRGRFRIPGGLPGLVITALFPTAIALYALFGIGAEHVLRGAAFMALGPVLYILCARRKRPAG